MSPRGTLALSAWVALVLFAAMAGNGFPHFSFYPSPLGASQSYPVGFAYPNASTQPPFTAPAVLLSAQEAASAVRAGRRLTLMPGFAPVYLPQDLNPMTSNQSWFPTVPNFSPGTGIHIPPESEADLRELKVARLQPELDFLELHLGVIPPGPKPLIERATSFLGMDSAVRALAIAARASGFAPHFPPTVGLAPLAHAFVGFPDGQEHGAAETSTSTPAPPPNPPPQHCDAATETDGQPQPHREARHRYKNGTSPQHPGPARKKTTVPDQLNSLERNSGQDCRRRAQDKLETQANMSHINPLAAQDAGPTAEVQAALNATGAYIVSKHGGVDLVEPAAVAAQMDRGHTQEMYQASLMEQIQQSWTPQKLVEIMQI